MYFLTDEMNHLEIWALWVDDNFGAREHEVMESELKILKMVFQLVNHG